VNEELELNPYSLMSTACFTEDDIKEFAAVCYPVLKDSEKDPEQLNKRKKLFDRLKELATIKKKSKVQVPVFPFNESVVRHLDDVYGCKRKRLYRQLNEATLSKH